MPVSTKHKFDPDNIIPWDVIRDEYASTTLTLAALARKHQIGNSTIYAVYKREKSDWDARRDAWRASIRAQAMEIAAREAVQDRLRIYDATRQAADLLIRQLLSAAQDDQFLHRHLIQMEEETEDVMGRGVRTRRKRKWAESIVTEAPNGKNASDMARAIKDLAGIARQLDGVMDARDRARLDLDRDRLALQTRTAGMDDDWDSESGVAIVPAVDASLLDGALPDPGEITPDAPAGPEACPI